MYHATIVVGHMGRNPEMRYTPSGQAVTNFTVAAERRYTKDGGEQVKEVIWYNCSAWARQAEIVNQYGFKGQKVFVEGHLKPDSFGNPRIWTTKEGEPRTSFELSVGVIRFLEYQNDEQAASAPADDNNPLIQNMRTRLERQGGMVEAAKGLGGVEAPQQDLDEYPF